MKIIGAILFILFLPIYAVLYLFTRHTYGTDADGHGWYQELWDGNIFKKALAVLLAPVYLLAVGFLYLTFEWYEDLMK